MATATEGYKGHRVGSNKGKVHQVFDDKGKDAAIKKAVSLDIMETTARTWCSAWGSAKKKPVAKKAKAPAKVAKKAAKKAAKAPAKKAKKKAPAKRESLDATAA